MSSSDEARLGALLDTFQQRQQEDPSIGIGALREEAGELFPRLVELADCLGLLRASLGEETVPGRIGRFRIEARLGAGMSGTVYRAHDPERDAPVALKVMRESLLLSPDGAERFRREIRVAAGLDHPHAVPVLDHGVIEHRPYLVMPLLETRSLATLLDRIAQRGGPAPGADWLAVLYDFGVAAAGGPPAEAYARLMAALFAPVADVLTCAAEQGLVHRDLKPGNLHFDGEGRLLVSDFGLAKVFGEELTSTVAVLGTPGTMSPEQAAGRSREVDARTDIYGLGATLYQALTLSYPVEADSFSETLAAIVTKRPEPITAFCRGYPRDLAAVVSRCLEKDPADRYPDAGSLSTDLERVAGGERPLHGALPVRRRARRYAARHRRSLLAASGAAVVLLAFAIWWFVRPATVEVRVWPGGTIALNGETVSESGRWTGRVDRGAHQLDVRRERFVAESRKLHLSAGQKATFSFSLRPEDPLDRVALAELAGSYGIEVPSEREFPVPRAAGGLAEGRPAAPDRSVVDERLARFPEAPSSRVLVIFELLEDGLAAEAFAEAEALAEAHPGRKLPLSLALEALLRLGLHETRIYEEYRRRFSDAN